MEIRVMTEQHLGAADELRRLAGWNQRPRYCAMLLRFEPQGCFVAIENGHVIGTVTTTSYEQKLAWVGMMLVHPDYRRRGVGTRLMEASLEYLRSRGIECVRLDATPAGQPVYQKLGFVAEWTLTRHQGQKTPAGKSTNTRKFADADWAFVEKIDRKVFGVSRARILREVSQNTHEVLVSPEQGPATSYGMLRPGAQSDYLGPVVCSNEAHAAGLVAALLHAAAERSVFWDVPDGNPLASELVKQFGFAPVRPLTRMRLGPATVRSDPTAQLAIADPSLG